MLIESLKGERKQVSHYIEVKDLPEESQFKQLSTKSKYFIDTIKMIAYRAETAMADLIPDYEQETLTVQLHHLANRSYDVAIQKLCEEITTTEMRFPQTNLKMIFKLVSE